MNAVVQFLIDLLRRSAPTPAQIKRIGRGVLHSPIESAIALTVVLGLALSVGLFRDADADADAGAGA